MNSTRQVDIKLFIQIQILHPKLEILVKTTELKKLLLQLKIKQPWNQIQIQHRKHNRIHRKSMILPNFRFLQNRHKVYL